jgi:hypothetical protein
MPKLLKRLMFVALGLALAGCAGDRVREEEAPHHFSKDTHGNRIACYTTDVANEYECVPVYRRYAAYPYGYPYDPYWSAGFVYGWPYYRDVIVVQQPPPSSPPPRWPRSRR